MKANHLFFLLLLLFFSASCSEDNGEEMSVIQVVPRYETNRNWTYEGDTVQFTDLSTGNANSWNWTFDGGTPATSTEQNPKVIYMPEHLESA